MPASKDKIIEVQQRCINSIDDYLEYRYKVVPPKVIKDNIMMRINRCTKELETLMSEEQNEES